MKKALIIIGVVLGMLALFVWYRLNQMPELYKDRNVVENDGAYGEVWQVKDYLQTNLHDPASYEPAYWGTVEKVDTSKFENLYGSIKPAYAVVHSYRAKNGFGGLIKTEKVYILGEDGYVMGSVDRVDWDLSSIKKVKIDY